MEWILMTLASLLAGFVDAIVGGGGLVMVPALFAAGMIPGILAAGGGQSAAMRASTRRSSLSADGGRA